ncbi:MAG TPA: MFS transporter [Candidatus Sulfotelmatobacter sp.]|nr:MFS transporter [Candidatus Sulfotelmatobacter sp.]
MFKKLKNPLFVILFTVFLDMLGFGILIPVIPLLLADPASSYYLLPHSISVTQGYILLGLLTAVFPLGQFFSTSILGEFSDKFGRKKVLLACLSVRFFAYLIFSLGIITKNIPLLFLARLIDGAASGNIAVAQAAIADVTDPANRAKNFGLMGAAFGFGFIIGPFLGGKLSDPHIISWFNAVTPFIFAACLVALNILSVVLFFPETLKQLKHHIKINWSKSVNNIFHAYSMEKLRIIFLTNFLFWSGFSFFVTFFSIFLIKKFGFDQGGIGNFFAYIGIWVAFTQIVLTRQLSGRFRDYNIVKVALFGATLMVLIFFLANASWQFLIIVPIFAGFNGLVQAMIPAIVSKSADWSIQGEVLGVNSSVQALAQAIPPVLSGFIAARFSTDTPIIVAVVVMILASSIFFFFYKPVTETSKV